MLNSYGESETALYVAEGRPLESKQVMEVSEAASTIAFAVGMLSECFPGYRPGVNLSQQGETGQQVRRTLNAAVVVLDELKIVPGYWKDLSLNSTAIVLTLREVLGDPAAVRSFLGLVCHYPNGIGGVVKDMRQDVETLLAEAKDAFASFEVGINRLEAALSRWVTLNWR